MICLGIFFKMVYNKNCIFCLNQEIGGWDHLNKLSGFFKYYSTGNLGKSSGSVTSIFSLQHFEWMVFTIVLMVFVIILYRKMKQNSRFRLIRSCAILVMALYLFRVIWAVSIGKFSPDSMLPFHLCALMVLIDFAAVFSDSKPLKEFGYAVGLPGAFMAYLTPDINGFPLFSLQYQVYIFDHFFLMLIPLLWIFGDGLKLDFKARGKVTWALAGLAIVDWFINLYFHSNYMFVSKAPVNTPFVLVQKHVGYFGYLVLLVGGAFLAIQLMYLPWKKKS